MKKFNAFKYRMTQAPNFAEGAIYTVALIILYLIGMYIGTGHHPH